MLVILDREERRQVIGQLYSLLDENGELIFLTSREDHSPEWLSPHEWRLYCNEIGFEKVEIFNIDEYFRIVQVTKTSSCPPSIPVSKDKNVALTL